MATPGNNSSGNEDYLPKETLPDDETVRSKATAQSEKAQAFEDTVLDILYDLRHGLSSVESRVACLEDKGRQQPAQSAAALPRGPRGSPPASTNSTGVLTPLAQSASSPRVPNSTPLLQSSLDQREDDVDVHMDYSTEDWDKDSNSGDQPNTKLFKVEEKTEKFLSTHFSATVSNPTRRQWKEKYGAPNLPATACPNLDKVVKGRLPAVTKSRDKQLAKQQALLLDAVGPITTILEGAAKGELTQKSVLDAAQTALKLLGNASAHMSQERRRNALQSMNSRLVDMAEDDSLYAAAAPSLFGEGFTKKAKERDDELKCLNQASKPTSSQGRSSNFFRGGRSSGSQTRGGSGQDHNYHYRGRGGRGYPRGQPRYQPYRYQQQRKEDKKN